MSDVEKLIERLGEGIDWNPDDLPRAEKLMEEAAAMLRSLADERTKATLDADEPIGEAVRYVDEIAALRAENLKLQEQSSWPWKDAEITTLRAKLERAREGLEKIADYEASSPGGLGRTMAGVARATLEEIGSD